MKRTPIVELLGTAQTEQTVNAKGWVKTKRGNNFVNFIALNDGSVIHDIQIVADVAKFDEELLKSISTGACISVIGKLVASQGKGQKVEIQADSIEIYGIADPETYPLQKKAHSMEFLRENAHLRLRTNTFGAIFRIRHALSFAVHSFFDRKGFYYLHTPVITAADAEGAGQMFQVTTLDLKKVPLTKEGEIDFSEDFFGSSANLTVSGQLQGEAGALALSQVYTFGPTFRAENSNTARHLSEFWMIEPEMAFYDIQDNMALAEEFLKACISYVMEKCADDLAFLAERYDKELLDRLKFVLENQFERLTYTEAVEILVNSNHHKKGKFQYPVKWGIDLQSEHERYLVEQHFKKPVILINYPKEIKSFYMKQNADGKTVAAMDILFPGIGEIIGGSQREENYDKLIARVRELDMHEEALHWYLDLRRFGSAPHSGFGLGFERMMMFLTGMTNIRDVIYAPRAPKQIDF